MSGSTISVKITGDATGFTTATKTASTDLTNLDKASGKSNIDIQGQLKETGKSFRGLGELANGLGAIFGGPFGQIASMAMVAKDLAKGAAETLAPAIEKLATKFGLMTGAQEAETAATEEATVAQEGLDVAMDANPLGAIIEAVTLLALGFVVLWQNCGTFRNIVKAAIGDVKAAFVDAYDWFKSTWGALEGILEGPFDAAFNAIKTAYDDTIGPIISAVGKISGAVGGVVGDVTGAFSHIPGLATGGLVDVGGAYMVGEMGPEIVHLPAGASVSNHANSAHEVGGTSQVTQVFSGGTDITQFVTRVVSTQNRKTRQAVTAGSNRAFL